MDKELAERERTLERMDLDNQIAGKRAEIAAKKAEERRLKKEYGPDWKKVLGLVGKLKPNQDAIQDLYSYNASELRDMNRPKFGKRGL